MNVTSFSMNRDEIAEAIYLWALENNKLPIIGDNNLYEIDWELNGTDSISAHVLMSKE